MKSKLLSLFLALAASVGITFASVTIDGIAYNLNETDLTAEVTSRGSYSDDVVIPSQITYDAKTYSVTSIGARAFKACSSLTSVTIPNSIVSIGDYAFHSCSSLTSITIPNSAAYIGNGAFCYCSSLTSLTIPNSVTSIRDYVFSDCSRLASVIIPNSVTSIGNYAFRYCSSLTSVIIPNSVTSIGSDAFKYVRSIVYSGTATGSPWGAGKIINGYVDGWLVYSDESKTQLLVCSAAATGEIIIPNSVTSIGDWAFWNCSGLISVTIPNSVTSIGEGAFSGCSSLTFVTIPNSVTSIGDWAFWNCSGLISVTIPNSVTSIGEDAFEGCSNITSVVWNAKNCNAREFGNQVESFIFGDDVESIPGSLCRGMTKLTSITIPKNVTSIGGDAFSGCSNITSVVWNAKNCNNTNFGSQVESFTFGDEVEVIPNSICSGMDKLTSITIPNSVTSIGDGAFENCSHLTSLTIPNNVTSIGDHPFSGCASLTSIVWNAKKANDCSSDKTPFYSGNYDIRGQIESFSFGDDVEAIPAYLCSGITKLTSIAIHKNVTSIGSSAFANCSGLTSVTIPNSITSIGNYAFSGCSSLTKVNILDLAAWCNIGFSSNTANPLYYVHHLFLNDKEITDLTIPDSVTSIGNYAFEECSSLTTVTIPNSVTSIGSYAFSDCSNLTSASVPNSVTSIGGYAFAGSSIKKPVYNKHVFAYLPTSYEGAYVIPNGITSVISGAFKDCTGLASLTIPNSVISIGRDACSGCTNLLSVTINSNTIANGHSLYSYFGSQVTNYVIGNNVSSISSYAFKGASLLKNLVLGTNVKVIEAGAFADCKLIKTITCYSMRPPTVSNDSWNPTFPRDMSYSTIIYVPANYLNTYKMHDFWGVYDVRPIGAATTETTSVQVTPSETTATVAWPTVNGAETYEMVIKDKQGNVICTLIFNSNGQLTEIAFNAPSRYGEVEQTQTAGFSFTVTGLEEGTSYNLTITAKDSNGTTLDKKTIAFSTAGGTGVENTQYDGLRSTKVLRNGQLFILRGDKTYTVQGQEVR